MSLSSNFYIIVIELDSGVLMLSSHAQNLGSDELIPAIINQSSVSGGSFGFTLIKAALPDYVNDEFWINRAACVYDVPSDASSVFCGELILSGIIASEPVNTNDELTLGIIEQKTKLVTLPNFGEITATEYPSAPDESQGALKPLIIGTVENAGLIPIDQQKYSLLSSNINDTSTFITVNDAADFLESGSVTIDNVDYSYTSKVDDKLLGINVGNFHRAGSMVVQTGVATFLAAGHNVDAITEVKADGVINSKGTVDLSLATLSFTSLPTIKNIIGQENVTAEFDEIDASDTASLSINAIKAVTAVDTNISATGLPFAINTGAVELSRNGAVDFPPQSQDRIIKGSYVVTFSVNHNGNTSNAEVKIGGQVVWVLNGGSVVYNNSPVVFFYNESTNQLPISIIRDSTSGSIDVSVSAATRTISLGNLDSALYGQIANTKQFVANQTTVMPKRGDITSAQLAIEWFATDALTGNANVYFDDILLGQLNANNPAGQTISENVKVDITNQGAAALASSDINKSFAGGTASLNNTTAIFNESFACSYRYIVGSTFLYFQGLLYFNLPDNIVTGNHSVSVYFDAGAVTGADTAWIFINGVAHTSFTPASSSDTVTKNVSISAGDDVYFSHLVSTAIANGRDYLESIIKVASVTFEWNIFPITQNNQVTYQNVAQSARSLANAGITTSHSGAGQDINIEIPAPPRTVVNTFALPLAALNQWDYFTNKQVKITYSGGGLEKVALLRSVLLINYDTITNTAAKVITAKITGKSSNPADAIKLFADATGQEIDVSYLSRLKTWCVANNYIFSRFLNNKTDALQLLSRGIEQVGGKLHERDRLTPMRWFDVSETPTLITDDDFMSPPIISYAADVYNVITLKYKNDGTKYNRVIKADESNNTFCKVSQLNIKEKRYIEVQSLFIADDDTAIKYLLNYARRYAQQRKVISFDLPFTFNDLKDGSLLTYNDSYFKITSFSTDNGWISATAEEVK